MSKVTLAVLVASLLALAARADEPVLSIDTNRILMLSRAAISSGKPVLDAKELEFTSINYRCDADNAESLNVTFRYSPESEPVSDDKKGSIRTKTKYKVITVAMDKNGKVLSISDAGTSHQIKIESTKKTVEQTSPGDVATRAPSEK